MSNPSPEDRFTTVLESLLAGERLAAYESDLSAWFESSATNFLMSLPHRRGQYFDGVSNLTATVHSPKEIEFSGEMWIGKDHSQWKEPFHATAVDQRSEKRGLHVKMYVGPDELESTVFASRTRDRTYSLRRKSRDK